MTPTDEQLKMREERKKQRELLKKQSATKKEAKLRDRPKEVEPKTTTKSKSKTDKDTDLEKIKIQKESRETLERILKTQLEYENYEMAELVKKHIELKRVGKG